MRAVESKCAKNQKGGSTEFPKLLNLKCFDKALKDFDKAIWTGLIESFNYGILPIMMRFNSNSTNSILNINLILYCTASISSLSRTLTLLKTKTVYWWFAHELTIDKKSVFLPLVSAIGPPPQLLDIQIDWFGCLKENLEMRNMPLLFLQLRNGSRIAISITSVLKYLVFNIRLGRAGKKKGAKSKMLHSLLESKDRSRYFPWQQLLCCENHSRIKSFRFQNETSFMQS